MLFLVFSLLCFLSLAINPSNHRTTLVYPQLRSINDDGFQDKIFQGIKNKDHDGFYRHNVHVTGANGNTFEMSYSARYNEENVVHNLDEDTTLNSFGCNRNTVILRYSTQQDARRTLSKLTKPDESPSLNHALLTGQHLWSCPQSQNTNMLEGIRRVIHADIDPLNPYSIIISTEKGHLTDVFHDLDLSGTASLLNINHDTNVAQHNQQIQKTLAANNNQPDTQPFDIETSIDKQTLQDIQNPSFIQEDKKKKKKRGFIKRIAQAIVNAFDDFKPNIIVTWARKMKKALRGLRQKFKKIMEKIKNFEKKGTKKVDSKINFGFNNDNGKAKDVFVFTKKGGLEKYDGTAKELKEDIKNKVTMPTGTAIYCLDCFVGFQGSVIKYKLKLGGKRLGEVKLVYETTLRAAFEILMLTNVKEEYDMKIADIPIPLLSVPLGVMTLGFAIGGRVNVGVEFKTTFAYYKYVHATKFRVGAKYHLLGRPKFEKISKVTPVKSKSIGPIVNNKMKAEFYLRPTFQLIFSDVANVYAGPQPTLTFKIEKPNSGSCALKIKLSFTCPVYVGYELGFSIKGFKFPKLEKDWSLKLNSKKTKKICISKKDYDKEKNGFDSGKSKKSSLHFSLQGGDEDMISDMIEDKSEYRNRLWRQLLSVVVVGSVVAFCLYFIAFWFGRVEEQMKVRAMRDDGMYGAVRL